MNLTRRHFLVGAAAAATVPLLGEDAAAETVGNLLRLGCKNGGEFARRREVDFETAEVPGTIVVDTKKRYLYHVIGNGRATRYGVGVGDDGKEWTGRAEVRRKREWPIWRPTDEHIAKYPKLQKWRKDGMPGGRDNPMGARA
ncbi:L,D-transpeptidase, partial [Bradyrhizobium sp.]|uniref:L,D-transpeptidase n=1 Tax=Bradyrhizobium sp. TaxID=376 RepID=UPI00391B9E4A